MYGEKKEVSLEYEMGSESTLGADEADAREAAERISFKTKFFFGLGASGESAANWLFNVLALFYYQQVLGLSASLAAVGIAVSLIFDAMSDPLIGSLSDRFQSRFGRRHPFMFCSAIPIALFLFLIFNPPEVLLNSQTSLLLWFTFFTILQRAAQTFFSVPHLAMGAELSKSYYERTRIMSFNALFAFYGTIFMHLTATVLVFGYLFEGEGGRLYQPAYTPIVLTCSFFVVITILACCLGTSDQIDKLNRYRNPDAERKSFREFVRDVVEVLKNKNYRYLLLGLFFISLTAGTHETLSVFVVTFFFELTAYQWGVLIIDNVIGSHLAFFLAAYLHERFDKRMTIVLSCIGFSISWSGATCLVLLGMAPEKGSWTLVLFIMCFGTVTSLLGTILNISVMSALADIADEQELKTGRRQEGIFYSARTFFSKALNAFGIVIAGLALDFYVKLPPNSIPGQVAEDVVFRLGIVEGPFAMIWGVLAGFAYLGYRLDKQRYQAIRRELDERGAQAPSAS